MARSRYNSKGKSDKAEDLMASECQAFTQVAPSPQMNLKSWNESSLHT